MPEECAVRLPRLGHVQQKSAPSTAPTEPSTDVGILASVSLATAPVPNFRSGPKIRNEISNSVLAKTPKKWQFLEPVLVSKEDRWLTPLGAPPRRMYNTMSDALVVASSSRPATVEEENRVIHHGKHDAPSIPVERRPPLPRVASRRKRHHALELKALPASRGKQLPELRPCGDFEVIEACYTRDVTGKQGAFYRSTLDRNIKEHDCEVAAMAYHRQAATMYYQSVFRDQAASWRESFDRQRGIHETRWLLEHSTTDVGKPSPGSADDRHVVPDADHDIPIAPTSSPADSPVVSTRVSIMRTKTRKKRKDSLAAEDSEASESEEEVGAVSNQRVSSLKNSTLKPKQPLRTRIRRIRKNAREWRRHQAHQDLLTNSPSRRLSRRVSETIESKNTIGQAKLVGLDVDEESLLKLSDQPLFARANTKKMDLEMSAYTSQNNNQEEALRQVFELYDVNQSGSLDQSELASCLAEIGLRGKNETERSEIREILWSIDELEVSFSDFATTIVPSVRACLARLQAEKLKEYFAEADKDHSGMLSVEETLGVLRLMGTFPNDDQVKDAICRVVPEAAEAARTLDGSWLASKDILDLETFGKFIRELQESTGRARSERARHLVMEYHLSDEEKDAWFQNLVELHQTFCRYGSQFISKANAAIVVRECGLSPRHPSQRSVVQRAINQCADDDDTIDFKTLLSIGDKLREHDRQWLLRIFDKYDSNKSGGLSLSQAHGALVECGIRPRTHHEVSEIRSLIDEFDEDSSGEVDHEEFVGLARFVCEKLHRVQREEEHQRAVRYGWDARRFEELRCAFISFDEDGNETLNSNEVMQAVETLQRSHLREDINPVLRDLGLMDHSKPTKLDFLDFMKLMKALEECEHQRQTAKKQGFLDDSISRLRSTFKALSPNEEGLVLRDALKGLIVDADSNTNQNYFSEIQRELTSSQPTRVNFEVFAKFMKKKADVTTSQ